MAAITLVHDCDVERLDNPAADNNGIQDVTLEHWHPNVNFNVGAAGYTATAGKTMDGKTVHPMHALFRYDLNLFIPADAIIIAAFWRYNIQWGDVSVNSGYECPRLTEDWFEDEATWNDRKTGIAWATAGGTTSTPIIYPPRHSTPGWKTTHFLTAVNDAWDNRNGICQFCYRRYDGSGTEGYVQVSAKNQQPVAPQYPHHMRITYTLAGKTFTKTIPH